MDGQNSYDDELARRRAVRERQVKGQTDGSADPDPDDEGSGDEMPKFTGKDILAMVLAAYQVLLPFFLTIIAALLVVYLLFRYVFS